MTCRWELILAALLAGCAHVAHATTLTVWTAHKACGSNMCDPSGMCASKQIKRAWDACPNGFTQVSKTNMTDLTSCEVSNSCGWSRSCPDGSIYVSATCGDCWGCMEAGAGALAGFPYAIGRAYVRCCPQRPRVKCAEMLPCTFGPADDIAVVRKPVQRRSAAATCAEPSSFLGSVLASNISADPVFRVS